MPLIDCAKISKKEAQKHTTQKMEEKLFHYILSQFIGSIIFIPITLYFPCGWITP